MLNEDLEMPVAGRTRDSRGRIVRGDIQWLCQRRGQSRARPRDLGAALFGDDFEIANNVALHTFSVAAPGSFNFDSNGYDAGGIDPYFTLFGTGPTATFLASNYDQAFSTGGRLS